MTNDLLHEKHKFLICKEYCKIWEFLWIQYHNDTQFSIAAHFSKQWIGLLVVNVIFLSDHSCKLLYKTIFSFILFTTNSPMQ